MDETKLTEWEQLTEKATPGEWTIHPDPFNSMVEGSNVNLYSIWADYHCVAMSGMEGHICLRHNAEFIASAREAVPELCKEVRRLWKIEQAYAETMITQLLEACDDPVVFELLKPDLLKLRDYFISCGLMKE